MCCRRISLIPRHESSQTVPHCRIGRRAAVAGAETSRSRVGHGRCHAGLCRRCRGAVRLSFHQRKLSAVIDLVLALRDLKGVIAVSVSVSLLSNEVKCAYSAGARVRETVQLYE
jgi:hypothetical protein